MAIKNIIFDFGGVLLDWNPRYFYEPLFTNKEKLEYFLEHVISSKWNSQMDEGKSFEDCMEQLSNQMPEYKEYIMLYYKGWPTMLKDQIDPMVNLFLKLRALEQFKIYGLTNWSAQTFPIAKGRFKFLNDFDGIVVSGEEKLIKPDPKIYELLLSRYKLVANECLFIDDNAKNIEVAKKLGINALWCTNYQECIDSVNKLLNI